MQVSLRRTLAAVYRGDNLENKIKAVISITEKIIFIILFINGIVQSFIYNYLYLVIIEAVMFLFMFVFFKLHKKNFLSITLNIIIECYKKLNYTLCHIITTLGIICFITLDKIMLSVITIIILYGLMFLSRKLNPLRFLE